MVHNIERIEREHLNSRHTVTNTADGDSSADFKDKNYYLIVNNPACCVFNIAGDMHIYIWEYTK